MNSYKPLGLGLSIGLLVGLLLAGSHQVLAKRNHAAFELPLADVRLFTDIYARIKKRLCRRCWRQGFTGGRHSRHADQS